MRFSYIAMSAALLASAYMLGGMNRASDGWIPGNATIDAGAQQVATSFDRMTTGSTGAAAKTDRTAEGVEIAQVAIGQSDPATPPTQPKVDESALRYFARKGDTARLQAEISRLRALYPDWTPPDDPMAIPVNVRMARTRCRRMFLTISPMKVKDLLPPMSALDQPCRRGRRQGESGSRVTRCEGRVPVGEPADLGAGGRRSVRR